MVFGLNKGTNINRLTFIFDASWISVWRSSGVSIFILLFCYSAATNKCHESHEAKLTLLVQYESSRFVKILLKQEPKEFEGARSRSAQTNKHPVHL